MSLEGGPRGENPLERLVRDLGFFVLDGGLATTLEARGFDLDDPLWSARVLLEHPEAIRQVHLDFLEAGADCIVTASYQATLEGFRRRGVGEAEAADLMRRSVELGLEARDAFWSEPRNREGRLRPLVAASVGPYGAYLADGSEYTGDYDRDEEGLYAFHRPRWRILAEAGADLLACETLPSLPEARALLRLLEESPGTWAWMSFSCRDGARVRDGSRFEDAVRACDAAAGVAAVGVNCTAPSYIAGLLGAARRVTDRLLLAYPNSGETWDGARKVWSADPTALDWGAAALEWREAGAAGIGGCCRVGPEDIGRVRGALSLTAPPATRRRSPAPGRRTGRC
ncbi:MAG: homocysteine S-methyltransferase [Candidatus Palauibacterales bacterium]|nr:homocysteine S-methyltransferase [Candidatus Palauibacterales bacterium]MDP2528441.1 homocysteine S-methyltransferase [Candidatus Palauibacterales bacterium]MDP2584270.1 homocysteine S-methyltransferase [Candidatus Palauibacterales bacterium]